MKRVVIVCEGQTEQEFCRTVLYPHFLNRGILVEASLIKQSMGGIVSWTSLKKQIELTLKMDSTALVTSFIDYYGLLERHNFPSWEESESIPDKNKRMEMLESAMQRDINSQLQYRFIPYIQLHEFEDLLFIDYEYFEQNFKETEIKFKAEFKSVFDMYDNPELINRGKDTAPSKRLKKYIEGYNKPIYGALIAETIGLDNIRNKCPRFDSWLGRIDALLIQ